MIVYPSCLVFSATNDVHTTDVISRMNDDTIPFVCDFSRFGEDYVGSLSEVGELKLYLRGGQEVRFDHLSKVWWRRPQQFPRRPSNDPALATYVYEENSRFWDSALSSLASRSDVTWYNDPDKNRIADRKTLQLLRAAQTGFTVPRTLVTSDRAEAQEFYNAFAEVIFKSYAGNEHFWQPTRKLSAEMLHQLSHLHVCPIIMQEYVEGRYDYRVTVIDDQITTVRFDLGLSRYKYDVRIDTKNKAEQCVLPDNVSQRIHAFMSLMGLRYGSIDFRERMDGEFVFLEINPAGQFLYLDILAGTSISNLMAQALTSNKGYIEDIATRCPDLPDNPDNRPFAEVVTHRINHLE